MRDLNRFQPDAVELFVCCCKNGFFAQDIDRWYPFIMETIMPGPRERMLRTARLLNVPADQQPAQLLAAIKQNPGLLLAVVDSTYVGILNTERFLELLLESYRAGLALPTS